MRILPPPSDLCTAVCGTKDFNRASKECGQLSPQSMASKSAWAKDFLSSTMFPLALFTFLATTNAYIWPSPQLDELDQMRFEQPLAGFVRPCDLFIFDGSNSGRSDTADWIRTVRRKIGQEFRHLAHVRQAYHDMATHNIADGTGGMDGSIRFFDEMARPEVCFLSVIVRSPPNAPCSCRMLGTVFRTLLVCSQASPTATFPVCLRRRRWLRFCALTEGHPGSG